jgi:hypothetical protein
MAGAIPDEIAKVIPGGPEPAGLSPDEKYAWDKLVDFFSNGLGYALEMAGRPQTLYALADSPVGLAAWIIDHDIQSYNLIARVFDGQNEALTRDDIVDNITLYWLTNTAVSSARPYRESKLAFFAPKGVQLPTGVSAFHEEIYQVPESWARKAYPGLLQAPPKGHAFRGLGAAAGTDGGCSRDLPFGALTSRMRTTPKLASSAEDGSMGSGNENDRIDAGRRRFFGAAIGITTGIATASTAAQHALAAGLGGAFPPLKRVKVGVLDVA